MNSQTILRKLHVSALALSLAGAATSAWATIQTTSPVYVGAATTLSGNGGSGTKLTLFSQRMVQPIAYAGTVSSLQSNTLTDTNAAWADSQFGTNGTLAYIEFDNGLMVDIANTSAGAQSLSLAGSLNGLVSPGATYRVRPHCTIASLFGTNNEAGLQSGLNAAQADNIILQIPQTQQTLTIFYFNNSRISGWYNADFTPASKQIVYPEQGVMVQRVSSGDLTLFSCGPVKTTATLAPIEPGFNLVGTLQSVTNLTLASLNLYTGNPATGVSSGLNPSLCDNLLIVQPDGSSATYFYFNNGRTQGWYDASFNSASGVQVNAGSAFFIQRQSANGPFNWSVPTD